jgi:hypothetical protein
MKLMCAGGNAHLNDWFRKYNLPENMSVDFKYKTKAAKFYRERLRAQAEETKFDEPEPSMEDGLTMCEELIPKAYVPMNPPPEQRSQPEPEQSTMSRFGGFFGSVVSAASQVGSAVAAKASELKDNETLKSFGAQTVSALGTAVEGVKSGTTAVLNSNVV